jgi:hypothetical protein
MALEGRILRDGTPIDDARHVALNDIVVARGSLARVCRLDVAIDGTHLATFIADGLVIASPTGSTGYSFSAGGPILDPGARNLIVTPIAAYLSAIRSVVVGPEQMIRCTVVDAVEALVSIDGRDDVPLEVGDVVEVRAMSRPMIDHRGPEFAAILSDITAGGKRVFKTKNDLLLLTSSGTGGLESAVANLVSPGDEVVVALCGNFGERFAGKKMNDRILFETRVGLTPAQNRQIQHAQ